MSSSLAKILIAFGLAATATNAMANAVLPPAFNLSNYNIVTVDHPEDPAVIAYFATNFADVGTNFPLGISNNRQIAGYWTDITGADRGYTWQNGTFTNFDNPNAGPFGTGGSDVNDQGQVVGVYSDASGTQHGFLRTCTNQAAVDCGATYTTIDVPGAKVTQSNFEFGPGLGTASVGLNNSGTITGLYATGSSGAYYSDGFQYANGVFTSIDAPGAGHSDALGTKFFSLSNNGVLAGDYETQTDSMSPQITHGFLYDHGIYTPIFVPGSDQGGFGTQVVGVNNSGEAVGVFSDSDGLFHGFVYNQGNYFTLDNRASRH